MHKYIANFSPKFSVWILNDTPHNLVLIYERVSPDCRTPGTIIAPMNITITDVQSQSSNFSRKWEKSESRRLKMKNARNGHNHSSQAWYNRITNFKFECFYTPLGRGLAAPTTPQRKRERFSKNSDELFAEKDWRNATYGDNKNISDTRRCGRRSCLHRQSRKDRQR